MHTKLEKSMQYTPDIILSRVVMLWQSYCDNRRSTAMQQCMPGYMQGGSRKLQQDWSSSFLLLSPTTFSLLIFLLFSFSPSSSSFMARKSFIHGSKIYEGLYRTTLATWGRGAGAPTALTTHVESFHGYMHVKSQTISSPSLSRPTWMVVAWMIHGPCIGTRTAQAAIKMHVAYSLTRRGHHTIASVRNLEYHGVQILRPRWDQDAINLLPGYYDREYETTKIGFNI